MAGLTWNFELTSCKYSCEIFKFCDALRKTKPERKQILESKQYGLEHTFKSALPP